MGAVVLTGTVQLARAQAPPAQAPPAQAPPAPAAPPAKKVKDQGEYDIYNQTLKDQANPAALLKDLDTWAQKYPDSDWKDDRLYYYIAAYNGTNQPAKVLEVGSGLMARDLKSVYTDPKAGPQQMLTVLYQMAVSILKLPKATAEQMDGGGREGGAESAGLRADLFHRRQQACRRHRCGVDRGTHHHGKDRHEVQQI